MKKNNKNIIQFLVWMRNGTAFCTSWFLILWLIYSYYLNIESIPTDSLVEMIVFVMGGVFLFSSVFTHLFIKKWSFIKRLTCFMILISLYECAGFYYIGFFSGNGTPALWFGFLGIILLCYFSCISIYQVYSKKQGELYTQALLKYQQERGAENGK